MADEEPQEDSWETESENEDEEERYATHEVAGGDLTSFWDTEAGWVKDAHLMTLDELRKVGYPDVNANPGGSMLGGGEKPLGSTGLDVTPKGLALVWNDLAESWNMSQAKVQRITLCHGLCLFAKDPWYMDIDIAYRKAKKLVRGTTDLSLLDDFESSLLIYSYPAKRQKRGGSMAFLTNRLGMVAKIDGRLAVPQTTALIELSVASIMTLRRGRVKGWVKTMNSEYKNFREYGVKRKEALEKLLIKLNNTGKQ